MALPVAALATPALAADKADKADKANKAERTLCQTRAYVIHSDLPVEAISEAAGGGAPNSRGAYARNGRSSRMMTFAQGGRVSWLTPQHEGFHQFAHMMVRGQLPIWVNEDDGSIFRRDGHIHRRQPARRRDQAGSRR